MDNRLITPEAIAIKEYINKTWTQFTVELECRLSDLFPRPNRGCVHIWTYGSADVVVRKHGKIIAIIEPGGSHHFTDEKQIKNDRAKWKLCEINGVGCLRVANSIMGALSNRQKRKMLGKYLFKK